MSTLHERLADLATDAPAPVPDPLLWDRAARFHRRRRAGTAGILAVTVVLVGVLTGLLVRQTEAPIRPAAPGASSALPTVIARPSPWLPGTGGNPIGPLAALVPAERSSLFGTSWGVVGISATTGEYRFLDLPDDAGQDWAMSPDGRHVAYWTTGEIRLSPNLNDGDPAAGVAIYDSSSGDVVRHAIATDHGLSVDVSLWWADGENLVFSYLQWVGGVDDSEMDQSSARGPEALFVWTVGEPVPVASDLPVMDIDATNGQGLLLADDRVLDVERGTDRPLVRPDPSFSFTSALDPSGFAVAYARGNRNPGPLAVTDVRRRGSSPTSTLVREPVRQAVAWIDESRVAYLVPAGGVQPRGFLESVDIRTAERERVLTYQGYSIQPGHLATELLAVDPVDREAPVDPTSPRVLLGWSIAALVIGGYAAWFWRRRVQP